MITIAISRAHRGASASGDVRKGETLTEEEHRRILAEAQRIVQLFADDYEVGIVVINAFLKEE